jgi:hypothetical protein
MGEGQHLSRNWQHPARRASPFHLRREFIAQPGIQSPHRADRIGHEIVVVQMMKISGMQPACFDRVLRPVDMGGQLAGIVSADIVPSIRRGRRRWRRWFLWIWRDPLLHRGHVRSRPLYPSSRAVPGQLCCSAVKRSGRKLSRSTAGIVLQSLPR